MALTIGDLIAEGADRIRRSPHIDHWQEEAARFDAEAFLASGTDGGGPAAVVPARAVRRFERMVDRRVRGEPAARILGSVDFLDLEVRVRDGAFFPRISSETMTREAARRLRGRRRPVHVDLATGVGPVALGVAHLVPAAEVHGVDILPAAVEGARANARRLGLRGARFHLGDLFAPLPPRLRGRTDAITIHPPYIGEGEVEDQPQEITAYEPAVTLTDFSPDGLGMVRRVAAEAPGWLRPNGWLLIEVGTDLGRRAAGILRRAGYRDVETVADEYGITRTAIGRRPRRAP